MSQREAGVGAGMKQKYTIWPRGQERPRSGPASSWWYKQCVGPDAGAPARKCVAHDLKPAPDAPLLEAGGSGRGNVQLGPYHSGRDGGHAKSEQLTPGEEVRIRAPEREKRVRIEPLRRARNLLGFATFQVAKAGLYYSAAG